MTLTKDALQAKRIADLLDRAAHALRVAVTAAKDAAALIEADNNEPDMVLTVVGATRAALYVTVLQADSWRAYERARRDLGNQRGRADVPVQ